MIAHNSSVIVCFKKEHLSGEPGIGIYRLKFNLSYKTQAWTDKQLEFKNVKAEVSIDERTSKQSHFLDYAEPSKPIIIKTRSDSYSGDVTFNLILNSFQISLIEDIRKGDDLRFKLRIFGETYGNDGSSAAAQSELTFPANQKEWLDTLRQIKYGEFLLFEIPIPTTDESDNLKDGANFLSEAKRHFMIGNYDDTVATCRKALDSIAIGLDEESKQSEAKKEFKTFAKEMSKEQRILLIREAVKHYTHLAHHPTKIGEKLPFNRQEASFTLGATAALISFALQNEAVKLRKT